MGSLELSNYQDGKLRIKNGLIRITQGFVEVGYELKQIRDNELYKLDGYGSITEFAKREYNLEQWDTSRFIGIYDKYGDGSSPKLLDKYDGYKYGILAEMMSLTENEQELVSIHTTRAEIRDIKLLKKEAESAWNAPAHVTETIENTQSEADSEGQEKYILPEDGKLVIEFFRPKQGRDMLKELSMLFKLNPMDKETVAKAAEVINPSGHYMFRSKFVILMFEEDKIRHNKFGGATTEFSYMDFFNDVLKVFNMSVGDPWVAFYGKPEPEPAPVKHEPSKQEKKEQKPLTKDKKTLDKSDPNITDPKKDLEKEVPALDNLPGQMEVQDYPELLPEKQSEEMVSDASAKPEVITGYEEGKDESYNFAGIPKASDRLVTMLAKLFVEKTAKQIIYGRQTLRTPTDDEIMYMFKSYCRIENVSIGNGVDVFAGEEIIEFSRGDEDLGICLYPKFANHVRKQLVEYIDNQPKELGAANGSAETIIDIEESEPESVETVEADIVTTREVSGEMEETIRWHVMTDEPDITCDVLIAVIRDKDPDVVIVKYFVKSGFQDNVNPEIEYKYWAYKPKSPLGC